MNQTATLTGLSHNRYRVQPKPRNITYSAGMDIRAVRTVRRPVQQPVVEQVIVEPVEIEQIQNELQPSVIESNIIISHYSNFSEDEKATLLARALERYGYSSDDVERVEASRRLLRDIIGNSYQTVIVTVSRTIPVIVGHAKKIAVAARGKRKQISVELSSDNSETTERVTAEEFVQAAETADEETSVEPMAEAIVKDQPKARKSSHRSQSIVSIVSVLALIVVAVVCVDTWVTNRNINASIDERISVSMQTQAQPSQ